MAYGERGRPGRPRFHHDYRALIIPATDENFISLTCVSNEERRDFEYAVESGILKYVRELLNFNVSVNLLDFQSVSLRTTF